MMDFAFAIFLLVIEAVLGLYLLSRANLLKTRFSFVAAAILMALAMGLHAAVLDYKTLDYINFLARWVEFFRIHGGFRALKYSIGNYNIPYLYFLALFSVLPFNDLYMIKVLSTLSDVLLAWSVMLLCSRFTNNRTRLLAAFFTTLFLPTVFLNSAVWGQCDSIYVAPMLLGIYCALNHRPWQSVVLAAVSFGFKLQAVFILPIFAVFLMTGKISWKHLLAFPARLHKPGVFQVLQLMRDGALREIQDLREVADADFLLIQRVEDPDPRRVAEHLEKLGKLIQDLLVGHVPHDLVNQLAVYFVLFRFFRSVDIHRVTSVLRLNI